MAYDSERPGRGGCTPVGVTNGRDSFLIYSDNLGTALALADLDENIVQTMRYDGFENLLQARGDVVRLPIGFAGGLFDGDTGLTRFVWRDYDADTGRFTALDPIGARGGDKDWYGYCVDDPVNRVDVWGLWSLFGLGGEGQKSGEGNTAQGRTGRDDNPYCKVYPCDDNGTMQGNYKPLEGRKGVPPFMIQFPMLDPIVWPFESYYERHKMEKH